MIRKQSLFISCFLLMMCRSPSFAASFSGIVKDKNTGSPLNNVLILIKNGPGMTHTDVEGKFTIDNITPVILQNQKMATNGFLLWEGSSHRIRWNCREKPTLIELYSLQGRCLYSKKTGFNSTEYIALPRLSFGNYILRITINKSIITRRLLHIGKQVRIEINRPVDRQPQPNTRHSDSLYSLIFMRDDYIKKEMAVQSGATNIPVHMAPDPSYYVFDQNELRTYDISISDENQKWLDENWKKEEYVPCTFSYNGQSYGQIGIRYKGSYSLESCFDENGNKLTPKISLKVKFDKYNDATRFYGLKRLNFHAMNFDMTYLHDRLAYSLFREMGVIAPRATHCKLFINGKYHGLFVAVEEVDGRFVDNRFPADGEGNLYKEAWPCPEHRDGYADSTVLQTNNGLSDSVDVSKMVAFADAVRGLTGVNFGSQINTWIDLNYMMRYIAVDQAVINWDGIMTWYTTKDWIGNHNYYWYEERNDGGRFWLIPWDLDASFGVVDDIFERLGVPRWYCGKNDSALYPVIGEQNLWIRPPARDHFINMLAENAWQWYTYYGSVLLKGPFSTGAMQQKLSAWTTQIDQAVNDEPFGHGYQEWKMSALVFYTNLDYYRNNFKHLMDTTTLVLPPVDQTPQTGYKGLSLIRDNNFELTTPDTVFNGAEAYSNVQSTITFSRNYSNPLSAQSDLLFNVVFRDAPGNWAEWAVIILPFEQVSVDLSGYSYCIVDICADGNRDIRINLGSGAYPNEDGPYYGWNCVARAESTTVALPLYKVAYPDWGCQEPVLDKVLSTVNSLMIEPSTRWNNDGSQMVLDPDTCVIHVDNIRFIR